MDWNGMDYWNGQKIKFPGSTGLIGHVLGFEGIASQ